MSKVPDLEILILNPQLCDVHSVSRFEILFKFCTCFHNFHIPAGSGCLEMDTDYAWHDVPVTGMIPLVFNWRDCVGHCEKKYECLFWTYIPALTMCFLKTSDQGRRMYKDAISGPKGCLGE